MAYSRLIVLIVLFCLGLSQCFVIPSGRNSVNEVSTRQVEHHEYEKAHLHQGDIREAETHLEMGSDGKIHPVINKWPGGKVPYVIDENGKTDKMMKHFKLAVKQYDQHTCIRFVRRTNEKYYLKITFTSDGCFSDVGQNRDDIPQELSINPDECDTTTVVMHEMMHAIGFNHEQSRPDRNEFIKINFKNIEGDNKKQFAREPELYIDLDSPYDIHSIMQYGEDIFAKPGLKTMEALNGGTLGPVEEGKFAESDLYEINEFYNCNEVEEPNEDEEEVEEPNEDDEEVEDANEETTE